MRPPEGYLAATGTVEGETRDRGSRFRAILGPAASEDAAKEKLTAIARRFPDATHHCWAWRLGNPAAERSSDAGEPAGTAGMPILQTLRGAAVSDVVAVVVRWFGGTKLGKGGLARAYATAAREALAGLRTARRVPTVTVDLELPYECLGAVKRLLRPPEIELTGEEYAERATLGITLHETELAAFEDALAGLGLDARGATGGGGNPPPARKRR